MGKVSTENVRKLLSMATAAGEGDDGAAMAYAYTACCLDELLAFRNGYDPAERLPEVGQAIRVDYTLATVGACSGIGVYALAEDGAQVVVMQNGSRHELPWDFFTRWYPIGGEVEV